MFIVSCISLTKHKTIIWKFRAPAKLTLHKVIIVRYETILHQSEHMHFYSNPCNYTNKQLFTQVKVKNSGYLL